MSRPFTRHKSKRTAGHIKPKVVVRPAPPSVTETPTVSRFRPAVRRVSAWVMIGLGSLTALANWFAELGVDIMPGGHSELYFLGGLTAVVTGAWMLGAFSQPDGHRRQHKSGPR